MPNTELTNADLPDIQGLVINGYGHLICTRYLFIQIKDPVQAKDWLRRLLPEIRSAARREAGTPKPECSLNIGFTCHGLQMLGLQSETLEALPREFSEGMAGGERPRVLGDTDDNGPDHWDFGGPSTPEIDLLLMFFGTGDEVIQTLYEKLMAQREADGLHEVYKQDSGRISNYEPFGFHDGISQPVIAGAPGKLSPGETPLNAGEFLLGYLNGYGTPGSALTVLSTADRTNLLPIAESDPAQKDFGRNGTYLIFRKLAQDVSGFWSFLEDQATKAGHVGDEHYREWLGAKMVGRWKNGDPLVQAPDRPEPTSELKETSNDFQYLTDDPDGMRCPVGAHIRRANPRDSLPPGPDRSRAVANRHRMIRRGRHYEDHRPDAWPHSDIEHGLCFIALNADIQRQFEFVQQTWINSPKFNGLYDNKDPLIGDNDGTGHISIPMEPVRMRLCGLPRFTRLRGGGYFFMPSMSTLRFLASETE